MVVLSYTTCCNSHGASITTFSGALPFLLLCLTCQSTECTTHWIIHRAYGFTVGLLFLTCYNCFQRQKETVMQSSSVTYQRWPALKSVNTLSGFICSLLLLVPWISQVWCLEFIPEMGRILLCDLRMFAPIWSQMKRRVWTKLHLHEYTSMNLKLIFISFTLPKPGKYHSNSVHCGIYWLV